MKIDRTERLLNLVIALLTTRGMTRHELRTAVPGYPGTDAAFERAFERDKRELRASGIPVDVLTDPLFPGDASESRYRIEPRDYALRELDTTAAERVALALAAQAWEGEEARSALAKLGLPGMPEQLRVSAVGSTDHSAHAQVRDALLHALVHHQPVTFDYLGAHDESTRRRRVEPHGLGRRFGHWYLIGHDLDRHAPRSYRLDRIQGQALTSAGTFTPPPDFDIHHALSRLTRPPEHHHARIRVRPGTCWDLRLAAGDPTPGVDILSVPSTNLPALARMTAHHGPRAHALEPPELARMVRELLTGTLTAHHGPPPAALDRLAVRIPGTRRAPRPRNTGGRTASAERLQRLLSLVPYLLDHPGAPLEATARRFRITPEQLVRDLELLFVSGEPGHGPEHLIEASWEDGRIYLRNADTLAKPLRLTGDEALALLAGLASVRGLSRHLDEAVDGAIGKITDLAGGAGQPDWRRVVGSIPAEDTGPHVDQLQRLLAAGHQAELTYHSVHRDTVTTRTVDPLRMFPASGHWYLAAWCHDSAEHRTFRLDRILDLRALETPRTRHDLPEPTTYKPARDGTRVWVALGPGSEHFAATVAMDTHDEGENGWRLGSFTTTHPDWAVGAVTAAGGAVVVLAPAEVREAVRHWAQDALGANGA